MYCASKYGVAVQRKDARALYSARCRCCTSFLVCPRICKQGRSAARGAEEERGCIRECTYGIRDRSRGEGMYSRGEMYSI